MLQYNIKKKEEVQEAPPPEPDNPLMRKKKTPEELAREAEAEDQDDFTSESQPRQGRGSKIHTIKIFSLILSLVLSINICVCNYLYILLSFYPLFSKDHSGRSPRSSQCSH